MKIGDGILIGKWKDEDISWTVLDIKDGKALLLANNIVTYGYYMDEDCSYSSWKDCYIKYDLESVFKLAFNDDEKSRIFDTQITMLNFSDEIETTVEKLFLLTPEQIEHYIPNEEDRNAEPMSFISDSSQNEDWSDYIDHPNNWWCMMTEPYVMDVDCVHSGGRIAGEYGGVEQGIRPAMWIKID